MSSPDASNLVHPALVERGPSPLRQTAPMKLRCLVLMDTELVPLLFGDAQLARITEFVDVVQPAMNATAFAQSKAGFDDVGAIIGGWGMPQMDAKFLARIPQLRVLFYAAGTVKSIATDASWAHGVRITTAALANAVPTAEYTLAAIIFSLKHAWQSMHLLRQQKEFDRYAAGVHGCYGGTVGLLSLGKVGRLVAERLRAFEVTVLAYDPFVDRAEALRLGVQLVSLEEIFAAADVVSCHMPLTEATQRSLGRAHFAAMKPGATFINTARGLLVREPELIEVLQARPDLHAVLDVMESEPPPPKSALFTLPNVVMTPHIAGSIGIECRRMGAMILDEVQRYLAHEPLRGEVWQEQLNTLA